MNCIVQSIWQYKIIVADASIYLVLFQYLQTCLAAIINYFRSIKNGKVILIHVAFFTRKCYTVCKINGR